MRQANRLVGNDPGAAVVETLGGLALLAESTHTLVVTGASGPITVDGRPVAYGRALRLSAGQRLTIGVPAVGLRSYVGLAGGLSHPRELTSRSTDTLSGLGPRPLASGDRLDVAARRTVPPLHDLLALDRGRDLVLDVVMGPRDDWFTPAAVAAFLSSPWRVSPASSRVGVRLDGEPLTRSVRRELPSEPCVRGSVQVAADGRPIVFGPDHPVTGGYPVIAVVVDAHTDLLAQARAGQIVRFARHT
jgi:biotin-dependent carboxylase-like uncharacterized protein